MADQPKKNRLLSMSLRITLHAKGVKTDEDVKGVVVLTTERIGAEDLGPTGHPRQPITFTDKELAPLRKRAEAIMKKYYKDVNIEVAQ